MTDVTVVIPSRNRVGLLRTTLDTVLAQEGADPQVVIVDDGSDPAQAAAVRALAGDRVRVLRNESSRGVAAARNQGVEAAGTTWVAFLDDDDLWTPRKLGTQLAALAAADAGWAYSGAVKFAVGPVLWQLMPAPSPEQVERRLADRCIVPAGASNVLAHRQTALDVGGFDEGLQHMADWDLWLKLLETGTPAASPDIAVGYRLHPATMSLNPEGMLRELAVLDERWRERRGGRALAAGPTHLWVAMSHLRAGARRRAAASYLRAVRTRPRDGLRGALRTLHPAPPRPAHVTGDADAPASRLKRVERVEVPTDMTALLRQHAAAPPAPR